MIVQLIYTCALSLAMCGCRPSAAPPSHETSRSEARAAMSLVGYATYETHAICAARAYINRDASLAAVCEHSFNASRASLMAAQSIMDEFGDDMAHTVKCSLMDASESLQNLSGAVRSSGDTVPLSSRDAVDFVRSYVGVECKL